MKKSMIFAGKRILVVDDDETFRTTIRQILEGCGAFILEVGDGKSAQNIVAVEQLDMVFSDIRMPGCSGIELLHFVKRTKPDLPVVLTTGFGEIKETKEAHEMGAKGFLAKPFSREDFQVLLRGILGEAPEAPAEADDDFCKLSIDDFVTGKEIKFDIFIRLAQDKFVKIAHKGDDIPVDRILNYKSKGITHLYMRKSEFLHYIGFNLEIAKKLPTAAHISKEKKVNFLKHTGELILERCFLDEIDQGAFEAAKSTVETTVAILSEAPEMGKLLSALNSHSDHLYAHCVGVSFYASMIARALGWENSRNLYKVTMGGLLHDVGKKELDRELLQKNRAAMSAEEVKLYETHPFRGMEILSTIQSIPGDVLQIVQQHHENCLGTGWPSGLNKNAIHPMTRVVSLSNEFCAMVIKTPWSNPIPVLEALEKIYVARRMEFDLAALGALSTVFNPETLRRVQEMEKAKASMGAE